MVGSSIVDLCFVVLLVWLPDTFADIVVVVSSSVPPPISSGFLPVPFSGPFEISGPLNSTSYPFVGFSLQIVVCIG